MHHRYTATTEAYLAKCIALEEAEPERKAAREKLCQELARSIKDIGHSDKKIS
jgi:hypothetical protein